MAATHLDKIGGLNSPDGVSPHLNLDAIETLKTIQGIINSYLANSTTEGRREIPTPQLSPVPKFQDVKRDADAMNGGQIKAVRQDADHSGDGLATQSSNPEEPEALKLGANGILTTNSTYQSSQGSPAALGTQNGGTTTETPDDKMAANGSTTVTPASHNGTHNEAQSNTANGKPHTQPSPDQDRLCNLADEVTRAVSQPALEDGARIKAANAALELATALRPPGDTIMGWFANMSVISAVHLFQHWGAFDLIPTGQGDTITQAELAEKINADEALVARVASMLTASRVLLHHPPSPTSPSPSSSPSLAHTPTSLLLTSTQPLGAMFALLYNHINEVSTIFPAYFDTYGRKEPTGPAHVPTTFFAGHPELDHFSMLKRDEKALRNFNLAMRMTSKRVPVTGVYDMSRVLEAAEVEGRETVWVDVGGGDGHTVLEFLRAYPRLRAEQCVVQDLEEVVSVAREQNEQGEGGELRGVRWVALDFLREAPVKGALVYYLRHVLRDYSDPVAVTILSQVARGLTDPDARILISEQINPDVSGGGGPLPLYAAFKDFSMLSIAGKERSVQQFAAVADAAGLRVSGVYLHGPTQHGVVELALKGTGDADGLDGF